MTNNNITVKSVTVEAVPDEHPDLSYLGTYQSDPGPEDRTIDRKEMGDWRPGEHRYFVAEMGPETTGNPESVKQDYERMETHGREWVSLLVRAEATIVVDGVRQTIRSGTIGGVESDAPDGHLNETAVEQFRELQDVLRQLGAPVPIVAEWSDESPLSGTLIIESGPMAR